MPGFVLSLVVAVDSGPSSSAQNLSTICLVLSQNRVGHGNCRLFVGTLRLKGPTVC